MTLDGSNMSNEKNKGLGLEWIGAGDWMAMRYLLNMR